MHLQFATYRIEASVSDEEFAEANRGFADTMAEVPGLMAKTWLKAADGLTYGGVYLWRDREAYEAFIGSELWASVEADDSISDLRSSDFEVMEDLSRTTQPGLAIVD